MAEMLGLPNSLWAAAAIWFVVMLVTSVVTFGILWLLICLIPADFFLRTGHRPHDRHPILHAAWVVIRNILGAAMLATGIAFSFLPGPGVPWLLLGLALMDLPGKHEFLRKGLRMPSVQRSLNWLRRKGNCCELKFPEHHHSGETGHPDAHQVDVHQRDDSSHQTQDHK
ncbi:hypothetical protein [Planctomicrobium sp. SH527]|uniref:hypothetical protein n=1 Tax=Planctomicrobium sp. SH527 TaxID=3448123 RepID=UPI003F5C0655